MYEKKNGNHGDGSVAIAQPSLSSAQKGLIREQLARILASPLFSHSKRFPEFLRHTVNRALDEDTESVKERTIGVEVFGRDANYDTSVDPVVRMTAVEVRKRLTQYYQAPNREREPRIEFERGSYVPEFRFLEGEPGTAVTASPEPAPPVANAATKPVARTKFWWAVAACVAVPSVLVSGFLMAGTRKSALDLFWAPVAASKSPVLICMPDMETIYGSASTSEPQSELVKEMAVLPVTFRKDKVSFGDAMAVSSVAGLLGAKDKEFHVRHSEEVGLDDLRDGPVVLIGAFTNQWALQLGGDLRWSFMTDGDQYFIKDAQNPSARQWIEGPGNVPMPEDYGLVSRVQDPTTGRIVITAAGIRHYGTQAAGECITDDGCLAQAEKLAPGDWSKANIQMVIETTVIGENPGKARVLAARLW
jgi:hypothetical protein